MTTNEVAGDHAPVLTIMDENVAELDSTNAFEGTYHHNFIICTITNNIQGQRSSLRSGSLPLQRLSQSPPTRT